MKCMNFLALFLVIVGLLSAPALGQGFDKTFTGNQSSAWHLDENWDPEEVPKFDETVLIPANKTCKVFTGIAHAKSVEVEATAVLGVVNSNTLHLHPTSAAPTGLAIDGKLFFKGSYDPDVPALLILEVSASGGTDTVVFTGSGVITAASGDDPSVYGPARIEDQALVIDPNDPWGFRIDSGLTFKGAWDVPINLDSDGLMLVDGGDTMDIHSPGACKFSSASARNWSATASFASATMTASCCSAID